MSTESLPKIRVEVVDDAEYADEIAELEALRDQVLHTLADARNPELARELLAGWPVLS